MTETVIIPVEDQEFKVTCTKVREDLEEGFEDIGFSPIVDIEIQSIYLGRIDMTQVFTELDCIEKFTDKLRSQMI